MKNNLFTENELIIILDSLNFMYVKAVNELEKNNLGDIERKNWEYAKKMTCETITKIEE